MVTVKIKLNVCRISKSGKYPIVIQVIHNRRCAILPTGLRVEPQHFDSVRARVLIDVDSGYDSRRVRDMNKKISLIRRNVLEMIKNNDEKQLTIEQIREWYKHYTHPETLFPYFERMIEEKRRVRKYGIASAYQSTLNSLKCYCPSLIKLDDITCQFVRNYEFHLQQRGLSPNTTAYYMRNFRTVYNRMVEDAHEKPSAGEYPFRKVGTTPMRTIKRALSMSQIKAISQLDLSTKPDLELARDMFMASFYMRGIAFVDLAYLQRSNIINGHIIYNRRKTGMLVSVQIIPLLQKIIDRYSSANRYIFQQIYASDEVDVENDYKSYRTALVCYNQRLKVIGRMANLDVPLTGYMARHTWATTAKIKGASTSIISEGLGHSSERITQVYLKSFDNSVINRLNTLVSEL